jgi:hypothetical protein
VAAEPSATVFARVEALFAGIAADQGYARLRRLMEIDWTEADASVEAIGLPRLMQNQLRKLRALPAMRGAERDDWLDLADAIRYSERHDRIAQDALWWLSFLASMPAGRRQ